DRRAPDRPAPPAVLPGHRQHRQPADEQLHDDLRAGRAGGRLRLRLVRPAVADRQRDEVGVHPVRPAPGPHQRRDQTRLRHPGRLGSRHVRCGGGYGQPGPAVMLTRIEVDGFKNLLGLQADFGAFTCIVGENGTGTSNVFGAIQFLSLLADNPLMEAAQKVRGGRGESADPRDLFWNGHESAGGRIVFGAEMIVPREVEDDFGRTAVPSITFLRYELELGYERPAGIERVGRLTLVREQLSHINQSEAAGRLAFDHSVSAFRKQVITGRRGGTDFISTHAEPGGPVISIHHHDGGGRGRLRPAAASKAPTTAVSTVTQSDHPTILAARREMQSWRRLALEPSALRAADRYVDPKAMEADGRHLASTLFRIAGDSTGEAGEVDPERVYARIANRLSDLSGVKVERLFVTTDDVREQFTVMLQEAGGLPLPARSLSEGTLRFLALCV